MKAIFEAIKEQARNCAEKRRCFYLPLALEEYVDSHEDDTEAWQVVKKRIEEHIGWEVLYASQPNEKTIKTAKSVSTGLSCLSKKKINALVECAEWMTKVQVKLYMPELIPNE